MKYVVPYLRARRMKENLVKDDRSREEVTQEQPDEIDELFMRLERITPPPTLVEDILASVKMLSHMAHMVSPAAVRGQGAEVGDLVAHGEHCPPS